MNRNDLITLISVAYSVDDIGQRIKNETPREVFCAIRSASQSEFFEAGRAGLKPAFQAIVSAFEYAGEDLCEYNGTQYRIYRTYVRSDETVELYLERRVGVG